MSTCSRYPDLQAAFRRHLPEVRAVSFDVFDTLFVRALHEPEALFDVMGLKLGIDGFRQLRTAAQARAFQQMHREGRHEIRLEDIYRCYPDASGQDHLGQLEQQLEQLVLRPNPEMLALLEEARRHGKVIALTSDMYLPESFFQALLERFGIQVEHLLISSDCDSTKRDDGALFVRLQERLGLPAEEILHIGDNPLGDVQRAAERGLRSLQYHAPWLPPAAPPHALDSIALGLSRHASYCPGADAWWRLGWQFGGPVLPAFLDWIRTQAGIDGVDLILFVSRDGYLMHQLHQALPRAGTKAVYLQGSRVSFSLASVTEQNFALHLPFLLSGADNLTLQDLLRRIGLDLPDEQVLRDLGLSSTSVIGKHNLREMERFLCALRPSILKLARECRRGLYQHLLQLGLDDGMRVAFVDVGWNGTTQKAFQAACEGLFKLDICGYYLGLGEPSEQLQRSKGIRLRSFCESVGASRQQITTLYQNRAVAELFFSAPYPTTIGYRYTPQQGLEFIEDRERGIDYDIHAIVASINRGILDYVRELEELYRQTGRPAASSAVIEHLLQLLDQPTASHVELIGQIYNWDAWASSEYHHTYFARQRADSAPSIKPDLWPAGWASLMDRP